MTDISPQPAFKSDILQIIWRTHVPLLSQGSTTTTQRTLTGIKITHEIDKELTSSYVHNTDTWDTERESPTDYEFWEPLIPPYLRGQTLDDDTSDQWLMEIEEIHAELIELYLTLTGAGWQVHITHSRNTFDPQRFDVNVYATPPTLDMVRASSTLQAWSYPTGITAFETRWTTTDADSDPLWHWQPDCTHFLVNEQEEIATTPRFISALAIASAPAWTLTSGIDSDFRRHSTGSPMPQTTISSSARIDDNHKPSSAEVAEKKASIESWASEYGFHTIVQPATPSATKKTLSELDLGETGYYLLEFDNGDCYLGQSVDISERLKGHRLVHKDISSIRLSPDPAAARMANPLRHLLRVERELLAALQQTGLHSRNKSEMTYISGKRALDEIFAANRISTSDWLAQPIQQNSKFSKVARNLTISPNQRARGVPAYKKWLSRTDGQSEIALNLIRTYIERCVPLPLLTEYDYWVLSSPERIPPHRALSNLSIGWTEAFRLNIDQSGHLSGWVQVNGVELFGDGMSDKSIVRFLRQHPGVIIDEAPYQASGPFNYNVIAENLDLLDELLDDVAVTRAAATAALHLMRKSKVGNIKNSHNPILVRAVSSRGSNIGLE